MIWQGKNILGFPKQQQGQNMVSMTINAMLSRPAFDLPLPLNGRSGFM